MSHESIRDYQDKLRAGQVERAPGALPAHYPACFGCGPEAVWGLHVECRRVGEEIHASHVFVQEHSGAPGIAHGGMVAALLDDVSGFVLFIIREPAVTRHLEVDYVKPVLIGVRYDLIARVTRREGRKVFVTCEGRNPDGVLTFSGKALFLTVDLSHFDAAAQERQALREDGQPPVAL